MARALVVGLLLLLVTPAERSAAEVIQGCGMAAPFTLRQRARIGAGTRVLGDITAVDPDGALAFGRDAFMPDGTVASAPAISLQAGASVATVLADELRLGLGIQIREGRGTPLPGGDFCTLLPVTCGGPDVVVAARTSATLEPGTYGQLVMGAESTLALAPGRYDFCGVRTSRRIRIVAGGGEQTTLNVAGSVSIGSASFFGPADGTPRPVLNAGGTRVHTGRGTLLHAFIFVPNGKLNLFYTSELHGCFCAAGLYTDHKIVLAPAGP